MITPSPSDLLWVIGFPSEGRWILPLLRESVRAEWPAAIRLAKAKLGDDVMAREMMETAIQQTQEFFADERPTEIEDVRRTLRRFYWNALRRERRKSSKLSLWGLSNNLEVLLPPDTATAERITARIDVNTVLQETPPQLRHALLTRYGARAHWQDVANEVAKSVDAIRMQCARELRHLRAKLNVHAHEDPPEFNHSAGQDEEV
jgi:DNA-directed RNA polymerase specialized sigma24 family protein